MRKKIKGFSIKVLKDVSGRPIIDNSIWLYYANVYVLMLLSVKWLWTSNRDNMQCILLCNAFLLGPSRLRWQTSSILLKKIIHRSTVICCFVGASVAVERWKCRTLRYCLVLYLGFGSRKQIVVITSWK